MARELRLFTVWEYRSVFSSSLLRSFLYSIASIFFSFRMRWGCKAYNIFCRANNEAVMHLILYFYLCLLRMWNVKKIFRAVLLNLYILCCYLRTVAKFMYVYVPLIQCCVYNIVKCFALSFAKRCWMDSISHSRDNRWMEPNGKMLHENWISEEHNKRSERKWKSNWVIFCHPQEYTNAKNFTLKLAPFFLSFHFFIQIFSILFFLFIVLIITHIPLLLDTFSTT